MQDPYKPHAARCPECGTVKGTWHTPNCKYRLGMPADEFICQHIGDSEKHEECFQRWKALLKKNI